MLILNEDRIGESSWPHFLVDRGSDADGDNGLVQRIIIFLAGSCDLVIFPTTDRIAVINR